MLTPASVDPLVYLFIHLTGLLVRVRSWLGVYSCSHCILGNCKQARNSIRDAVCRHEKQMFLVIQA